MGHWFICEDPEGNIYNSEAEMARAHGVLPSTFNQRKLNGLPLKSCLKPCVHAPRKEKEYFIFQGQQYHSLRDCCIKLDIPYKTVYYFISKYKLSPEKAIKKQLNRMRSA